MRATPRASTILYHLNFVALNYFFSGSTGQIFEQFYSHNFRNFRIWFYRLEMSNFIFKFFLLFLNFMQFVLFVPFLFTFFSKESTSVLIKMYLLPVGAFFFQFSEFGSVKYMGFTRVFEYNGLGKVAPAFNSIWRFFNGDVLNRRKLSSDRD